MTTVTREDLLAELALIEQARRALDEQVTTQEHRDNTLLSLDEWFDDVTARLAVLDAEAVR